MFDTLPLHELLLVIGQRALSIILIILVSRLAMKVTNASIDRVFAKGIDKKPRSKTIATLLKNGAGYVITFIAIVMILDEIGINTGSLIAAAGVAGVAIGFGAQNLVRDIVTGFFILLENQYNIEDFITAGGVSGVVEEMGIRVTKIRDFGGQLHIVPNGEITSVTNHMGSAMRVLVEVDIAYEVDVNQAILVLEELFERLPHEIEDIVEGPKVLGVKDLGDSGVTILTMARAKPMTQWSCEREIRKAIKLAFDEHSIEIPYPRQYLVFDEETYSQKRESRGLEQG